MKKSKTQIFLTVLLICSLSAVAICTATGFLIQLYINSGAKRLVVLEKEGKLSKTYGYVWQEINATKQMAESFTDNKPSPESSKIEIPYTNKSDNEYPSLSAITELNALKTIIKNIRINDRNGIILAQIQSTQTCINISNLNEVLLKSLIETEDRHFYTRKRAWDFNALLRATLKAAVRSVVTRKLHYPRGSSTIHMQVARFLLMQYDSRGYAYAEKSMKRKIRELKLAEALRIVYTNDDILTVYINHCVSAGRGMLGYYDISTGLFGVSPESLSIPQSLYLARLVKWNRQVPVRIITQIKASMPSLANLFSWNNAKVKEIEAGLDTLTFKEQKPLIPPNSYLIDLANEYWKKICRKNGMPDEEIAEMDIADPESMIRRYGNITINLTIDYRLQKKLERMIAGRGFGPDTTIRNGKMKDKLRVAGQYYVYALIDAKSNKLLAYCSRDMLGSRLQSLHVNKNPNGSSLTKPILYALAYDLKVYKPSDAATDDAEFGDTCGWSRSLFYENKNPTGMIYHNVPEKKGYQVKNFSRRFDGYDFLFNHLSRSNNILAVETIYRLSTDLQENSEQSRAINKMLERLAINLPFDNKKITGPQLYSSLVAALRGQSAPIKGYEQNYSVALGTLELSLYEQLSLFNILYNNRIILRPSEMSSLFIKNIKIAGKDISFRDTITYRQVFSSLQTIRPVHLGLHKRLLSNPSDRLERFDLCSGDELLSNFAKSGTTDDIIRPFNVADTDTARTSFGLWNAVLRLRLTGKDLVREAARDSLVKKNHDIHTIAGTVPPEEILDVTLAATGECNAHYTGERDGKTLHGYVSRELLHAFGIPCSSGFYTAYEKEILKDTEEKTKYANQQESDLPFLSRALIRLKAGLSKPGSFDEIQFERSRSDSSIRLKGKSYKTMLKFTSYMGANAQQYHTLLEKLKKSDDPQQARNTISQILAIDTGNQILKRDLQRACTSLLNSLND